MSENLYEISSLSDYIEVLAKIHDTNRSMNTRLTLYYRGQSKKYISTDDKEIVASKFRNLHWDKPISLISSDNKVNSYYRFVANSLTPLEEQNFLAYCQHHGLETPLVDITIDPLVALFFAVENEDFHIDEGVIYIFDHKNMFDISDEMIGNINGIDFFDILFKNTTENIYKIIEIANHLERSSEIFLDLFSDLIDNILFNYNNSYSKESINLITKMIFIFDSHSEIKEKNWDYITALVSKLKENDEVMTYLHNFISPLNDFPSFIENFDSTSSFFKLSHQSGYYLFPWYAVLLKIFISENYWSLFYRSIESFKLPRLPNLLYRPNIIYDRMLDQSGSFIVQSTLSSHVRDSLIEITPDYTILVKNKRNIKKSLELLGINKTKYFNDPDNLADFINQNYM